MPRSFEYFLADMLVSVNFVLEQTRTVPSAADLDDETLKYAILWYLQVLGEAFRHIPHEVKEEFVDINWKRLRQLRNFVAHVYFGLDWGILLKISKSYLPRVSSELQRAVSRYPVNKI